MLHSYYLTSMKSYMDQLPDFFLCEVYKNICLGPIDTRPMRYHIRAFQGRTYFTLIEDNKSLKHLHDCTLTITPKWLSE